nr:hypothetical protein CFP56_03217 [Quercus suber]
MLQQAYHNPNRSQPNLEELVKVIFLCIEAYGEVFPLIDALDECPEGGDVRYSMPECLARMLQRAPCVKISAQTRELPDTRMSMTALESEAMLLARRAVNVDIRRHVQQEGCHVTKGCVAWT